MGLLDFTKPKWQHKDPAVRLAAIEIVDPAETTTLAGVALKDPDPEVRRAAINRLADLETISTLADNSSNREDLPCITARKDQLLYDIMLTVPANSPLVERLSEISSPDLLATIAAGAEQLTIRLAAISCIDDQLLLSTIIEQKCGKDPARIALAKISDEKLLKRLSSSAASKTSRRLATEKLAGIEQQRHQPDESEIRGKALAALAAEAAELLDSGNWDKARTRLTAIKEEWQKLDYEGSHPAHAQFSETCAIFEKKSQTIEQSRQLEQTKAARYEAQQTKFNEICTTIEGLTGSTDDRAEELRDQALEIWQQLISAPLEERLVPSEAMRKRFEQASQSFARTRVKINNEKELVTAIEKDIRSAAEQIANDNLKKAATNIKAAAKKLDVTKLKYFSRATLGKLHAETIAALAVAEKTAQEQNTANRQEICTTLEALSETDNYRQAEGQLKALEQSWQAIEPLAGPAGVELAERFNRALNNFTEKRQTFDHEQDWQSWANLSLKEKLIEQVEALKLEEELETIFNTVKEVQAAWKKIGPVPRKKSQKIWDRFHATCDRNFKRTEPYLEEMKKRRDEAMARRREICLAAEELAGSTAWNKTAASLKALQEEWKGLLHGSRREEDKLYKQFRQACDQFFSRRQEDYESRADNRLRSLAAKEEICDQAEKLAADPQYGHPGKFRVLQTNWKKIGQVPKEKEKEVWKRFRAACDSFFNWLDEKHLENLKEKEALCKELEELLATGSDDSNHKEIAGKLAGLQQQWKEIGAVPHKQQEAIRDRFQEPSDAFFKARQQQFEKRETVRRENQLAKEELLARAEELASQGSDKKTSNKLQALQKEWQQAGPAPRAVNDELDQQFKALCDAFFEGRRQYFSDLAEQRLKNQKKKESLCLRLENLTGQIGGSAGKTQEMAMDLAEVLKQAMQDNIMLAGRRHDKGSIKEEVRKIEQEWEKIGLAAKDPERHLTARFKKTLTSFYRSNKKN